LTGLDQPPSGKAERGWIWVMTLMWGTRGDQHSARSEALLRHPPPSRSVGNVALDWE